MDSKNRLDLIDYMQWKKEDGKSYFSLFDYLSVQFKRFPLPIDAWVAFSEIFVPQFIESDGRIFIEECFKEKQDDYNRYSKEGLSKKEIEFWINIICLDGLFYDLPGETDKISIFVGEKLKLSWEMKLKNDFPNRKFTVSLQKDDDVGDFLITLFEVTDW